MGDNGVQQVSMRWASATASGRDQLMAISTLACTTDHHRIRQLTVPACAERKGATYERLGVGRQRAAVLPKKLLLLAAGHVQRILRDDVDQSLAFRRSRVGIVLVRRGCTTNNNMCK